MLAGHPLTTAKTVEEELLRLLARQGRRVPFPVFLAAALIAAIAAARSVPTLAWSSWLAGVTAILAVRWLVLDRLPDLSRLSEQRRLQIAVALSGINGIAHGLSLAFFPYLTNSEKAIQSFLLVGLCAGSVATTAGYRPVFVAYLTPTLGPLVILWAMNPDGTHAKWINESTAVIIALFGVVLLALAKDAYRLFRESFEIRLQQAELNRQLKAALDLAESASRAKTRFLASASHDLRQPVHTLSLFAAALEMRPLDERSRDIAHHINTALQVLASQLDSLLDVSKLDAGVMQVSPGMVLLAPLLNRIVSDITPVSQGKGLELMLECPPSTQVNTDVALFERVVRNLAGNAIKYTESGLVRVEAFSQTGSMILMISDTGPGIPEAEHARIFEEFYQIDNPERDRTKGLGLGLSIVRRLVDLLGIRLEMVSAPGAGTQFFLVLPEYRDDSVPLPAQPEHDALPPPDALHILFIDDETAIQEGMRTLLTEMGCRISIADSTESAAAAAQACKPDIVVADLRLRGGDNGIAAVRAVRALYPGMPAILVSGDTAPDRLREADEAGMRLLHKPVPANVLKQAIAETVGGIREDSLA